MSDKHPLVAFYRATRPQAPRYARLPHNEGMMECSKCRGLMLPDKESIRKAHRAWHATVPSQGVVHSLYLKHPGNTIVLQPCFEVAELGGHYELLTECQHCTEDVCPCTSCEAQHKTECARWSQVWALFDEGEYAAADALTCSIMADRPTTHRTAEDLYNAASC